MKSLEQLILFYIYKIISALSRRRLSTMIEIDLKTFPPCHGKEISVWEWGKLKRVKYIVHVSKDGKITLKTISK